MLCTCRGLRLGKTVMAALMVLAIVVAACVPHPPPPREKFEPEPDLWWREA
jgi:hypothetical protein